MQQVQTRSRVGSGIWIQRQQVHIFLFWWISLWWYKMEEHCCYAVGSGLWPRMACKTNPAYIHAWSLDWSSDFWWHCWQVKCHSLKTVASNCGNSVCIYLFCCFHLLCIHSYVFTIWEVWILFYSETYLTQFLFLVVSSKFKMYLQIICF